MSVFDSIRPIWKAKYVQEMVPALIAPIAAALLTTPKVALLNSFFNINQDTPIATFTASKITEVDFAPSALSGPFPNLNCPNGFAAGSLYNLFWNATGGFASPLTIFGYYIYTGIDVDWVVAEMLPVPVPIAVPGDWFELNLWTAISLATLAQ